MPELHAPRPHTPEPRTPGTRVPELPRTWIPRQGCTRRTSACRNSRPRLLRAAADDARTGSDPARRSITGDPGPLTDRPGSMPNCACRKSRCRRFTRRTSADGAPLAVAPGAAWIEGDHVHAALARPRAVLAGCPNSARPGSGKNKATIRHALTHSIGVPAVPSDLTVQDLADWDRMCALIASSEPWWEPGTETGYHAMTWGFVMGEIVRRSTDKPISQVLIQEVAAPLGIADELFFGVPESELGRLARLADAPGTAAMMAAVQATCRCSRPRRPP
ncbi:serine hydrolase domain-containing protein [Microtetraspora malaysiensis]|uniref:serine hydrolase domain-containing protein n=1 Tax=Microtetraspora malaysiensis TaxID=161358 RepID=UPI003D8FE190